MCLSLHFSYAAKGRPQPILNATIRGQAMQPSDCSALNSISLDFSSGAQYSGGGSAEADSA